jgi:hypothetical protein
MPQQQKFEKRGKRGGLVIMYLDGLSVHQNIKASPIAGRLVLLSPTKLAMRDRRWGASSFTRKLYRNWYNKLSY